MRTVRLAWLVASAELNSFLGVFLCSPWPHLSWVFLKRLPGARSSSTILIWLNTWFILSLWWGRPFVLIGPVNLQPPFRAIYWPGPRGSNEGERLQFSIYPLSQKRHLKSSHSLLLHVVFLGLNWLFIQPTTLVVNGLSVKLIHLLPILLTFGSSHEGPYLAAAAVGTDICPRARSERERDRERARRRWGRQGASLSGRRERHFKSEGLLDVK